MFNEEYYKNNRQDGDRIGLLFYSNLIKNYFKPSTILDYGCGGSDWTLDGFDVESNESALSYLGVNEVYRYEPARNIDERRSVDCIVSFDVLEHVFISDVAKTIRNMLSYATNLAIIKIIKLSQ